MRICGIVLGNDAFQYSLPLVGEIDKIAFSNFIRRGVFHILRINGTIVFNASEIEIKVKFICEALSDGGQMQCVYSHH